MSRVRIPWHMTCGTFEERGAAWWRSLHPRQYEVDALGTAMLALSREGRDAADIRATLTANGHGIDLPLEAVEVCVEMVAKAEQFAEES